MSVCAHTDLKANIVRSIVTTALTMPVRTQNCASTELIAIAASVHSDGMVRCF